MTQEDDPVFTHPEAYGIENPEAPGEPDRDKIPSVPPVPGTGKHVREEHQRRHDAQGHPTPDAEFKERKEREELEEIRREPEEG